MVLNRTPKNLDEEESFPVCVWLSVVFVCPGCFSVCMNIHAILTSRVFLQEPQVIHVMYGPS